MTELPEHERCPCDARQRYADCCQGYHFGQPAPTPEALMRSRYSAFVRQLPDYLLATWHVSTRPATLDLNGSPAWASLRIVSSSEQGDRGQVHFQAIHRVGAGWGYLEERSEFVREQGRWFYLQGDPKEGQLKPGRNEPCPCGSGKKHKACCYP